jgi:hypothetical protein
MNELRHANLYRWSVVVVIVCLIAGIVEAGVFVSAVHTEQPNWDLALAVNRAGILTSAIAMVAGVVGACQKPTLGVSEVGVVVGFLALWLTLGIEGLSHVCFICI